jgi:hypothetical protein
MFQYLAAFRSNKTAANANRLLTYLEKHPLAVCVASQDDFALIADAHRIAGR